MSVGVVIRGNERSGLSAAAGRKYGLGLNRSVPNTQQNGNCSIAFVGHSEIESTVFIKVTGHNHLRIRANGQRTSSRKSAVSRARQNCHCSIGLIDDGEIEMTVAIEISRND